MNKPFDAITKFIFKENELKNSDVILVPGGMRPELISKAVELYQLGYSKYILPSGGVGPKLKKQIENNETKWKSEWEYLKNIAIELGVPDNTIIKENQATHTFENAKFSWEVLQKKGMKINRVILVCKAFHARRALLTYQTVFPDYVDFIVCPIMDSREINKDNWFLKQEKIDIVMKEVEKIGQYFGRHIPNWNKNNTTSNRVYAFIDGQNLYKGSLDEGIDLDYYKLRHYLLTKFNVKKAFIFLGYIKSNEKLYSYLRKCGFELIFKKVTKDKNGDSKGNVDVDLTLETILRINEFDKAVLITSDGDFAPLVKHLKKENKYKQIISPSEVQCSHLLKQAVGGRILYLNNIVNKISKKKKRAADR